MTVFVTGSSRGIGRGIAAAFHGLGHNVVLNCAHSGDELAAAERAFLAVRGNVLAIQADVGVYAQAKAAFELIEGTFGGVDVLVNNAGAAYNGLFQEMAEADWRRVMGVNIGGVVNCCHLALPRMIRERQGTMINVSSVWGERGAACEAVYAMTKGAVNAFTRSLAKEVGSCGVTVNAIACGAFDTAMNGFLSEGERRALAAEIPAGRFGRAEEAAAASVFLASDGARYINGQVIAMDGGWQV